MKKKSSSKKSAFSLIELSIVLIIIGLLVAGVTGGAALIKNAEMRAVVTQYQGFRAGISAFYAQYNWLPGDYATAVAGSTVPATGTTACAAATCLTSAQDSRLQYITASVPTFSSESAAAFDVLQRANFVEGLGLVLNAVTAVQTIATTIPAAKIKNVGWAFDHRFSVGTAYAAATGYNSVGVNEGQAAAPANQNVLVLTGTPITAQAAAAATASLVNGVPAAVANATSNLATASLTGPDALSIDTKLDDGIANAGLVRGLTPGNLAGGSCYVIAAAANAGYVTASNTAKVCALTFDVDPTS